MDEVLKQAIASAPSLTVLVILVIVFVKFISKMQDLHAARTNEFITMVKDINHENSEARQNSREVIDKNSEIMTSVKTLLTEVLRTNGERHQRH